MSSYREHPYIAEQRAGERLPSSLGKAALFTLAALIFSAILILPLALGIWTAPQPASGSAAPRIAVERLRDWRAGYEAALDNGCRGFPVLSSPIRP